MALHSYSIHYSKGKYSKINLKQASNIVVDFIKL